MKIDTPTIKRKTKKNLTRADQDDLSAIVRIGRLANAIAFADFILLNSSDLPIMVQRRQVCQAVFLLGGYLYEAVHLVDELLPRYGNLPGFADLLIFRSAMNRHRDLLNEIAFSPGSHMESTDAKTKAMLDRHELDLCSLTAGCCIAPDEGIWLHAVFALDVEPILEAHGKEVFASIDEAFPLAAKNFSTAATRFIESLAYKLMTRRVRRSRTRGDS
jgi:hypothetical protein